MLYVLNQFEGRILDDDLATEICGETIRYGLLSSHEKVDFGEKQMVIN